MNKRFWALILAFFSLMVVAIGIFYVVGQTKRKVSYTQTEVPQQSSTSEQSNEPVEIQSEQNVESVGQTKETEAEAQPAKPAQVKIETPKPAEKSIKKVIEKNSEPNGEAGKIVDKLISWGFQKATDRKIDTIIVHSSYDAIGSDPFDVAGIIAEYKQYGVSAHYLIARDGVIYRLVQDQNIAYHAGVSKMPDGRTNVNSFSIGVEMINTKDGQFTDDQYKALNSLIASLKKKYDIKNILGHDEIAPVRKTDPWNIDWKKVNR